MAEISRPYRVAFMGASLDTGNMGVSALSASVIKLILDRKPDADLCLVIGNRFSREQNLMVKGETRTVRVVNYRLSPRASLDEHLIWALFLAVLQRVIPLQSLKKSIINSNRILRTLHESDLVCDIRGGDSFSNIYGLKRFILGATPDVITILLGKRIFLLPQTYGPYNGRIARWISYFILRNAERIYSRDRHSPGYLKELFPNLNKEIEFSPDVAFTLERSDLDSFDTEKTFKKTGNPMVGLNVNGLMYNGGYSGKNMFGLKYDYQEFVRQLLRSFYEKTDADILLVPHTFGPAGNVNSDPDACRDAYETLSSDLGNRLNMVTKEYNQHDIKAIIGKCDFFIGSRMHSCIAALSQEIPTVGVAYSKKFIGVFNSLDFDEYVVDARKLDMQESLDKTLHCFQERNRAAAELKGKMDKIKSQVNQVFDKILA